MKFAALRQFIVDTVGPASLVVEPGPNLPEFPGKCVCLTPITTPGLQMEGILDTRGWQIRSIGEQNSYASAEDLAFAIDAAIIALGNGGTQNVAGLRLVTGDRVGSPPTTLMVDDAQRHHFVCSYQFVVRST